MIDSNIITERGCGGGRRPDAQGPDIKIFLTTLFFVFRSVAVSAECAAVKGQLCAGVPCPAAAGSCVNIKMDWSDDEEQERARVGTRGQTAQTAPALTGENYLFMMQTTDYRLRSIWAMGHLPASAAPSLCHTQLQQPAESRYLELQPVATPPPPSTLRPPSAQPSAHHKVAVAPLSTIRRCYVNHTTSLS